MNSPRPATSGLVGRVLARLDVYAASACIILAGLAVAAASYAGAWASTEIALSALAGSALYLVLRSRAAPHVSQEMGTAASPRLRVVLNIIFVLALATSLLLSHVSWPRPQAYFVLMSVAAAAAAAELFCPHGRFSVPLVLIKALLIAVTLRAGLAYEFPGYYGSDTWSHAVTIESWAKSAHLTRFTPIGETNYYVYPVFHLFAISTKILSALPTKGSMFMSATLYQVFSLLSVFVVVRHLAGERAGLLAALLASFASFLVTWGAFMIPNALGSGLFVVVLMLVLKRCADRRTIVLVLLIFMVLIGTHTVSSFATAVALAGMIAGVFLWRTAAKERNEKPKPHAALVVLFWASMLSYWMFRGIADQRRFFDNVLGWLFDALNTDVALRGVPYIASDSPLNRAFFLLVIGLAIIGALGWLSPRERNAARVAVLTAAASVATVIGVFPILNVLNLLPQRWLAFAFLLAVAPLACGVLALALRASTAGRRATTAAVLVFAVCFFSVNSATVNLRAPFYDVPGYYPYARSEMAAVDHFVRLDNELIVADHPFALEYFGKTYLRTPLAYLGARPGDIAVTSLTLPVYVVRSRVYDHLYLLETPENGNPYLPSGSLEHRVYANATTEAFIQPL